MKKTYIRLLISNIVFLLVTILNAFLNFFNTNSIILFYLIFLIFIYRFIGYERNNKRYQKDIIMQIIIIIIAYYIIIYLSGIYIGFLKSSYNLGFVAILKNLIPALVTIVLLELIRYIFISKGYVYKSIILLAFLSLVMADITLFINIMPPLEFILLILMPSISRNIALLYITYKAGFRPAITFRIFTELPMYILPLSPALGIYLEAILKFLLPIIIMYFIYKSYINSKNKQVSSGRDNNVIGAIALFLTSVFLILIISLTSGAFKYFTITIGSNSMLPGISKGDIVLVNKLNNSEINNLKEGEVLVFNHNKIMIVHRIIRIMEIDGTKYFYTKGDNNNKEDGYPIKVSDIVGKKVVIIPYLGYPTLEMKQLFE